ncbi:MAG: nucleotidyltransferase domain-containing protein [Nitrospirae bacterium]|nr:nucleotidyltransferase domain-containing protein [Nitrospirota bacterium]
MHKNICEAKNERDKRGFYMVEKRIIKKVNAFVKELKKQKIKVVKVIIYGSRVSGKAHEYSDIDVAIISPDFGKDRYEEGVRLFQIASKIDPLIEPVPISVDSYKNDTWVPLIYEIRTKGIELKAA